MTRVIAQQEMQLPSLLSVGRTHNSSPHIFIFLVDLFLGFSLKKKEKEKNEGSLFGGLVLHTLPPVSHSVLIVVLKVGSIPI